MVEIMWSVFSISWPQWSILLAVTLYIIYRMVMEPFKFFEKQGVPFKKPLFLFGAVGGIIFGRDSMYDVWTNSYNEFKGKRFYGIFDFNRPIYALRDPVLIKQITIKDSEHFGHRPFVKSLEKEVLFGRSLFMMSGQRWKDMRAALSPTFTGSKIRQMFHFVAECSEKSTQTLLNEVKASPKPISYDMKDVFTRFTNDVIATSAFGVKVNSLEDRENEFYMMGKKSTNFSSVFVLFKFLLLGLFPRLAQLMKLHLFTDDQDRFYQELVHGTIEHREKNGIFRPDMIHSLMEARKGSLKRESASSAAKSISGEGLATVDEVKADDLRGSERPIWHDDDLSAQCFMFFLAGFDTSSTLLCLTACELMENPGVQQKLIDEVDEVKQKLGGKKINFDVLQKMKYLDMVISESLRKWPPEHAVGRQCIRPYEMTDDTGRTIKVNKGDGLFLPIVAIHRDPEYYHDPDRFDPERFSDERKDSIQPGTYLPFGSGPRICIGSRFALMECKAFIYQLLTTFTFEPAANSTIPMRLAKSGFSVQAANGFNLHLKARAS